MEKGNKIVCLDDRFISSASEWITNLPAFGEIYTVRNVVMRANKPFAVYLQEIYNPTHLEGRPEPGFAVERFEILSPV